MNLELTLKKYDKEFQSGTIIEIVKNIDKYGDNVINFIDSTIYEYEPLKKLITIIKNYYKLYEKIPNWNNLKNIVETSSDYNEIDREVLIETIKALKRIVKNVENGLRNDDSEYIRTEFKFWVQIQEQRKLGEYILNTLGDSNVDTKSEKIQDKIKKLSCIFENNQELGINVFDNPESVLDGVKDIIVPTYIPEIDNDILKKGGVPKGKLVGIVASSGVGKSAMACSIANSQAVNGYNVLQIFFEESEADYQKNHFAKWNNIDKEDFDVYNRDLILAKVYEVKSSESFGVLELKKCDDGDFTSIMLKKIILDYRKSSGIIIDTVFIDYFECMRLVNPTKDLYNDEMKLVSELKRLAEDLSIVLFVCFQGKPSAKYKKIIDAEDVYGSFQKVKKADLLIGIGKNEKQQKAGNNTANIHIIKSKMSSSGQIYENSIFNNGTMEIKFSKISEDMNTPNRNYTKKTKSSIIDESGETEQMFLTPAKKSTIKDASTISNFENERKDNSDVKIEKKKDKKPKLSIMEEIENNDALKLMFEDEDETES